MKFLIDMPLSPELVSWLEQRQHEAVHALDVGLDRASDEELMARARHEQHCWRLQALMALGWFSFAAETIVSQRCGHYWSECCKQFR